MARILDETFLSVHPRTLLWWQQREQCVRCVHVRTPEGLFGEALMQCAAVAGKGPAAHGSCIDAREREQCGPEALLFEERREVTVK